MSKTAVQQISQPISMHSVALVEFINSQREAGEAPLRHDHFMAKVPKVLGQEAAPKFRDSYVGKDNTSRPCYRLPKREACLMAMSYSYELQAKVFDRMTALEQEVGASVQFWQQRRIEGKAVRKAWGGAVQEFVSYAKKQGSQNAEKYFMSITKMEYAALEFVKQSGDKDFRDTLDAVRHTELTVVELAAQEALRQGMAEGLHYKEIFKMAKASCTQLAGQLRKYLPRTTTQLMLESA